MDELSAMPSDYCSHHLGTLWVGSIWVACSWVSEEGGIMKPDDYSPMRPIPLTERLPQPYDPAITRPQDCDPTGRCWFSSWDQSWAMEPRDRGIQCSRPHWLPWWALPLPEVES